MSLTTLADLSRWHSHVWRGHSTFSTSGAHIIQARAAHMVAKRLSLPVPKGFFVCPPLDVATTTALVRRAQTGFADLVQVCQVDANGIRWRLDSDLDGLHLYFGSHAHAVGAVPKISNTSATILGVTTVHASLDELPTMVRFDTPYHFTDFCTSYYTDVVDCASLYTLSAGPTEYVGVKWQALQSPVQGFMKPRDCTFVECCSSFTLSDGSRGYARSIESVDVACVPDLNETFGLVRMHIGRCGFVFRGTRQPGVLHAAYYLEADLKGSVPQWMIRLVLRGRAKALSGLGDYLQQRRLDVSAKMSPHDFVPVTKRHRCAVCQSKLSDRVSARFNCSICGEVVCATCQKVWYLKDQYRKASVCNLCSVEPTPAGVARLQRVSLTSKSGTSLSNTVLEEDPGYLCSGMDAESVDAYAALDTFVLESVRGTSRRQSVPLRAPAKPKPALRPSSASAPHPLVHLYTPPPPSHRRDRGTVLKCDPKVESLLQQLKELDFDEAVLAQYHASRHCDA